MNSTRQKLLCCLLSIIIPCFAYALDEFEVRVEGGGQVKIPSVIFLLIHP